MNKAALKAALDERGIAYDAEATNAELEALLKPALEAEAEALAKAKAEEARLADEAAAKAKAEAEAKAKEEAEKEPKIQVKQTKAKYDKVDIIGLREDGRIGYVRTYSLEMHGQDYLAKAEEFAYSEKHLPRQYKVVEHDPERVAYWGGER